MVTLTIDGRTVSVPEGTTILEAAQTLRISPGRAGGGLRHPGGGHGEP